MVNEKEEMYIEAEPWEPMETKVIMWTIIVGIISLIVLAALVNMFILSQH